MYQNSQENPMNNYNQPGMYNPNTVKVKTSLGLAIAAGIAGVVGIFMVLFVLVNMASGTQDGFLFSTAVQNTIGLTGLILIILSPILALFGIVLNKSRIACGIIFGVMSLPTMIALWLLAVLGMTALGIG